MSISKKKLESTKDYSKFKFIPFNRNTIPNHIDKLSASMLKHGFLGAILVTSDFYILDGQNRFKAAQKLGIEVPYIKENSIKFSKNEAIVKTIVSLQSSKSWKNPDYLNAWVSFKKPAYLFIKEIVSNYDLNVTLALLLADEYKKTWGKGGDKFKEGSLTLNPSQQDALVERADQVKEISNYKAHWSNFNRTNSFLRSTVNTVRTPGYDHSRMLMKLEKASHKMVQCKNQTEYRECWEEIYNYGVKKTISLFYFRGY